jgi:hypothetical protein
MVMRPSRSWFSLVLVAWARRPGITPDRRVVAPAATCLPNHHDPVIPHSITERVTLKPRRGQATATTHLRVPKATVRSTIWPSPARDHHGTKPTTEGSALRLFVRGIGIPRRRIRNAIPLWAASLAIGHGRYGTADALPCVPTGRPLRSRQLRTVVTRPHACSKARWHINVTHRTTRV